MFWEKILKRKKLIIIILIILAVGGYYYYSTQQAKKVSVSYTTAAVEKGTISVTITGSGQVSELNKVDLKPLGSGSVTEVKVKNGDLVKTDQVIATLDQRSNERALQQARASYASASASFSKVAAGATADTIKSSQNAVDQADLSYKNALTQLDNTTKSTAVSLNQAQKDLDDLLSFTSTTSSNNKCDAVLNSIDDKFSSAKTALDNENRILNDENVKPTLGIKDLSSLNMLRQSYGAAILLVDGVQNDLNVAKAYKSDANINTVVASALNLFNKTLISSQYYFSVMQATIPSSTVTQSQIDSYKSGASSQVSNMSSASSSVQSALQTLKDAIVSAQNNLESTRISTSQQISSAKSSVESTAKSLQIAKDQLTITKRPTSSQDIQIARSQVVSAAAQLQSAQDAYNNNIIKAPFAGQIAALAVQKGDQIGASTVIATLLTQQKIAIVALNETDVSKIKTGQQVILTFDALPDISLTGKVGEIDILGTVTQGVVTYNVKIGFDTENDVIKPGMSVNTSIITASKTDTLVVENSAVKTDDTGSYVEILDVQGQPQKKYVVVGIANDTNTEIISGINEGDQIVTQTISSSAATSKTSSASTSSSLRIPGLTGGGAPRD